MRAGKRDSSFVRGIDLESTKIADAHQGRRHRRVPLRLPIRTIFNGGRPVQAVLTDLSVRGCAVLTNAQPVAGDTAELRIPDLGILRGRVTRVSGAEIGIALAGNRLDRQKRADALMVFLNNPDSAERSTRYPFAQESVLETMNGRIAHCTIKDLSETGALVETALVPAIGEKVRIGQRRGTVVRHHADGIGVTFIAGSKPRREGGHGS